LDPSEQANDGAKNMKYLLLHLVGSIYETLTFQNFTQRLIRRKTSNAARRLKGAAPRRSWEDARKPSAKESRRLNAEAARSV
jgi:hypothetical protein